MSQSKRIQATAADGDEGLPDLAELCRIHEIGLDLIERSHDLDELLDRVLDEYESRLQALPSDALDARDGGPDPESLRELRGLVMFATQAAALKEKAVAAGELKRRATMLEESNARLVTALDEARRSHARLDAVLAALSSGVMIFDAEGSCLTANAAARELAGAADDLSLSRLIAGGVPENGEAEIDLPAAVGTRRTLLVTRRAMTGDPGNQVVLITDVTRRNRAVEERVRLAKLAEVLKTLSVLSHKINNPLTALLGRAQILQAQKGVDPGVAKAAGVIEDASLRIADLKDEPLILFPRQSGIGPERLRSRIRSNWRSAIATLSGIRFRCHFRKYRGCSTSRRGVGSFTISPVDTAPAFFKSVLPVGIRASSTSSSPAIACCKRRSATPSLRNSSA
jgi:PAS domain-containing protein